MNRRLQNKTFISTRPEGQNEELKMLLENEGAGLVEMPTMKIKSAVLSGEEENMLVHISQFSWIVFTSPNGIRYFFHHLHALTGSYYLPASIKLASIGSRTSKILMEYGHEATLENPGNTGDDLAEELLKAVNDEDSVLFPEGDLARGVVADKLSERASCEKLTVYRNTLPELINTDALNQIIRGKYDGIILTSPSGFNNLVNLLNGKTNLHKLKLICIGTTTASEVNEKGLTPISVAGMSNAKGIVDSILGIYEKES